MSRAAIKHQVDLWRERHGGSEASAWQLVEWLVFDRSRLARKNAILKQELQNRPRGIDRSAVSYDDMALAILRLTKARGTNDIVGEVEHMVKIAEQLELKDRT